MVLSYDIIFDTCQDTEFTFYSDIELMSIFDYRASQCYVLVVRQV